VLFDDVVVVDDDDYRSDFVKRRYKAVSCCESSFRFGTRNAMQQQCKFKGRESRVESLFGRQRLPGGGGLYESSG
jgi:hypothetical protein